MNDKITNKKDIILSLNECKIDKIFLWKTQRYIQISQSRRKEIR